MKIAVLIGSIALQFASGLTLPKQRRKTLRTPLLVLRDSYLCDIEVSRRVALVTAVVLASSTVGSTRVLADPSTALDDEGPRKEAVDKANSITFLIPSSGADYIRSKFGSKSPVGNPSLLDAVHHLSRKATWFADGLLYTEIIPVPDITDYRQVQDLLSTTVLLAVGLKSTKDMETAANIFSRRRLQDKSHRHRQCQFGLDCSMPLPSFVGPYDPIEPSMQARILPWTKDSSARRCYEEMSNLFQRWNSGDFVLAIMIFLNQFSPSGINWVKYSTGFNWDKDPARNLLEMSLIISKCGGSLQRCLFDTKCRTAVLELAAIDSRDQAASYRAIVSYESTLLRDISFCTMQGNNIFGCDATIPKLPRVEPITTFRGKPLTEDVARRILIGHLDDDLALNGSLRTQVSWVVACGDSEAYSVFPSQQQLFYPAAKGRAMWYDPIFLVETLDGRNIWCKRHYRVQPDKVPGTFRFFGMDNGIISDEFWTIVGVADDLSWIVLHYAGAASAVGQRFIGVLLCTADGSLPNEQKLPNVWKAVASGGAQPWEFVMIDNDTMSAGYLEAGDPPLDFFRTEVMAKRSAGE